MRQRLDWVDYARGIGIILVVFAHNLGGQGNAGIFLPAPLECVIAYAYTFHMPLFFFLSGLFAVQSYRRGFAPFLESKLRTILYPFVIWSLVEGVIVSSMGGQLNHPLSLKHQFAFFLVRPIEQMWFLQALFIIFVLFAVTQRVRISPLLFFLASLGLALYVMPRVRDDTLDRIMFHMVFFAAGVWLHSVVNTRLLNSGVLPLLGLFLCTLCIQLSLVFSYTSVTAFLTGSQESQILLRLTMAVAGIASVSALCEVLSRAGRVRWLLVIGEYSMPIYLMHTIIGSGMRILLMRVLYVYDPTTHAVTELVAGVGIPMLIAYGLKKCNVAWAFEWPVARRVELAV